MRLLYAAGHCRKNNYIDLRAIIMFMCHILLLNVAKMHLPVEVPFCGMRFQKILRSVNRLIVLNNVSNYT